MKIGYIASNIYRHTFEINEVAELLRQRPGTRVYSVYRPSGAELQSQRVREVSGGIVAWSPGSIVGGWAYLVTRRPLRLLRAGLELTFRSIPNPVYWFKNAAAYLLAMPVLADALRYGVTHLHANFGSSPATIAWLGKKILGTGLSITWHAFDIYVDELRLRDPLKRQKLRDADAVVAVHRHGLEYLRRMVPDVPNDRFHVIHISVILRATPIAGATVSQATAPGVEPSAPLLVAAGNLVPKKGFDVLVRAVSQLARDGIDVRARILGEGPERGRLEDLARAQGIVDRIEMPGYYQHAELAGHLAEAAALVMPSKVVAGGQRDGIPTVVVEAWLARTPVVASLVGGMAEVIEDGRTGLVFSPGDASALAGCVRVLLDSPERGERLAEEGYRTAVTSFSPEKNVGQLLATLDAVAGGHDGRLTGRSPAA
jgi:colanic acid/amylovoran biosynthesis glycosyltransferase